jgi:hypothetical protein
VEEEAEEAALRKAKRARVAQQWLQQRWQWDDSRKVAMLAAEFLIRYVPGLRKLMLQGGVIEGCISCMAKGETDPELALAGLRCLTLLCRRPRQASRDTVLSGIHGIRECIAKAVREADRGNTDLPSTAARLAGRASGMGRAQDAADDRDFLGHRQSFGGASIASWSEFGQAGSPANPGRAQRRDEAEPPVSLRARAAAQRIELFGSVLRQLSTYAELWALACEWAAAAGAFDVLVEMLAPRVQPPPSLLDAWARQRDAAPGPSAGGMDAGTGRVGLGAHTASAAGSAGSVQGGEAGSVAEGVSSAFSFVGEGAAPVQEAGVSVVVERSGVEGALGGGSWGFVRVGRRDGRRLVSAGQFLDKGFTLIVNLCGLPTLKGLAAEAGLVELCCEVLRRSSWSRSESLVQAAAFAPATSPSTRGSGDEGARGVGHGAAGADADADDGDHDDDVGRRSRVAGVSRSTSQASSSGASSSDEHRRTAGDRVADELQRRLLAIAGEPDHDLPATDRDVIRTISGHPRAAPSASGESNRSVASSEDLSGHESDLSDEQDRCSGVETGSQGPDIPDRAGVEAGARRGADEAWQTPGQLSGRSLTGHEEAEDNDGDQSTQIRSHGRPVDSADGASSSPSRGHARARGGGGGSGGAASAGTGPSSSGRSGAAALVVEAELWVWDRGVRTACEALSRLCAEKMKRGVLTVAMDVQHEHMAAAGVGDAGVESPNRAEDASFQQAVTEVQEFALSTAVMSGAVPLLVRMLDAPFDSRLPSFAMRALAVMADAPAYAGLIAEQSGAAAVARVALRIPEAQVNLERSMADVSVGAHSSAHGTGKEAMGVEASKDDEAEEDADVIATRQSMRQRVAAEQSSMKELRHNVLTTMARLATGDIGSRRAMLRVGCVSALLRLLVGAQVVETKLAMEALSGLSAVPCPQCIGNSRVIDMVEWRQQESKTLLDEAPAGLAAAGTIALLTDWADGSTAAAAPPIELPPAPAPAPAGLARGTAGERPAAEPSRWRIDWSRARPARRGWSTAWARKMTKVELDDSGKVRVRSLQPATADEPQEEAWEQQERAGITAREEREGSLQAWLDDAERDGGDTDTSLPIRTRLTREAQAFTAAVQSGASDGARPSAQHPPAWLVSISLCVRCSMGMGDLAADIAAATLSLEAWLRRLHQPLPAGATAMSILPGAEQYELNDGLPRPPVSGSSSFSSAALSLMPKQQQSLLAETDGRASVALSKVLAVGNGSLFFAASAAQDAGILLPIMPRHHSHSHSHSHSHGSHKSHAASPGLTNESGLRHAGSLQSISSPAASTQSASSASGIVDAIKPSRGAAAAVVGGADRARSGALPHTRSAGTRPHQASARGLAPGAGEAGSHAGLLPSAAFPSEGPAVAPPSWRLASIQALGIKSGALLEEAGEEEQALAVVYPREQAARYGITPLLILMLSWPDEMSQAFAVKTMASLCVRRRHRNMLARFVLPKAAEIALSLRKQAIKEVEEAASSPFWGYTEDRRSLRGHAGGAVPAGRISFASDDVPHIAGLGTAMEEEGGDDGAGVGSAESVAVATGVVTPGPRESSRPGSVTSTGSRPRSWQAAFGFGSIATPPTMTGTHEGDTDTPPALLTTLAPVGGTAASSGGRGRERASTAAVVASPSQDSEPRSPAADSPRRQSAPVTRPNKPRRWIVHSTHSKLRLELQVHRLLRRLGFGAGLADVWRLCGPVSTPIVARAPELAGGASAAPQSSARIPRHLSHQSQGHDGSASTESKSFHQTPSRSRKAASSGSVATPSATRRRVGRGSARKEPSVSLEDVTRSLEHWARTLEQLSRQQRRLQRMRKLTARAWEPRDTAHSRRQLRLARARGTWRPPHRAAIAAALAFGALEAATATTPAAAAADQYAASRASELQAADLASLPSIRIGDQSNASLYGGALRWTRHPIATLPRAVSGAVTTLQAARWLLARHGASSAPLQVLGWAARREARVAAATGRPRNTPMPQIGH